MRCAAYSCVANRPLHVPVDDTLHGSTAVAHFYDKLLKIKERLKTDVGRKLGEERHNLVSQSSPNDRLWIRSLMHEQMLTFLDAVDKEQNIEA